MRGGCAGLGGLLQGSGEDTLHLVLESLATVIAQDKEKAASWEAHISPCIIQLWARHIADPLLAMEAGAVIEALAAGPAFPHLMVPSQPSPPTVLMYCSTFLLHLPYCDTTHSLPCCGTLQICTCRTCLTIHLAATALAVTHPAVNSCILLVICLAVTCWRCQHGGV